MKNTAPSLYRNRLIILLILTFASVADLMVLFIAGKGFFGIYKFFILYGLVFILQETFKIFRTLVIFMLSAVAFLGVIRLLVAVNLHDLQNFFLNKILVPAAVPLYVAIGCILVFSGIFLHRYKVFR